MTEAEALDRALPVLDRAGLGPDVLAALRARRRSLSEILFTHAGMNESGLAEYLVGDPAAPIRFVPRSPSNFLLLHTLVATGSIRAAEWDDTRQPVDTIGKKLDRALRELQPVCPELYRSIYPLDRAVDGCFNFARQHGAPLIIASRVG